MYRTYVHIDGEQVEVASSRDIRCAAYSACYAVKGLILDKKVGTVIIVEHKSASESDIITERMVTEKDWRK